MSYILDALKKSEQERGRGGIPGVQTVHSSALSYNTKKSWWPYILIAAVLLNLVAILYFIYTRENPADSTASIAAATGDNASSKAPIQSAVTPATPPAQPQQAAATAATGRQQDNQQAANFPTAASTATAARQAIAPPATGSQSTTQPVPDYREAAGYPQTMATAESYSAQQESDILEFDELPETIRQQLPAIIISAHVYSTNPRQHSIVINNNFMEEGEYFLDGMVLDEITRDGAIFLYKDFRFHLGVVSGWQ